VAAHPDVVPSEHQHCSAENAGIENFLPHSGRGFSNRARCRGNNDGAGQTRGDAGGDHQTPARDPAAGRQHNADDQRGLEDFPKNNECSGKQTGLGLFCDDAALSRRLIEFAKDLVTARLEGADENSGLRVAGDDFFAV